MEPRQLTHRHLTYIKMGHQGRDGTKTAHAQTFNIDKHGRKKKH